jgi:hypothetical protein
MGAELPEQLVDGLFPERVELGLDHQLIERLARMPMLGTKLLDRLGVTRFEMGEQVALLAIDVCAKPLIYLAKHLEDRDPVRAFDRIRKLVQPVLDGLVIIAQ